MCSIRTCSPSTKHLESMQEDRSIYCSNTNADILLLLIVLLGLSPLFGFQRASLGLDFMPHCFWVWRKHKKRSINGWDGFNLDVLASHFGMGMIGWDEDYTRLFIRCGWAFIYCFFGYWTKGT